MKHYRGCPGPDNYCRCDEVDLTLRLSPEAQLDAIAQAEYLAWLYEDGGPDPGADWLEYLHRKEVKHEGIKP